MQVNPLRTVILLLVALNVLVACRDNGPDAQALARAESVMEEHPDSALAIVSAIDTATLPSSLRPLHALLLSQALDKNYVDTTSFAVLQPAIDHYLEHGTPDEKLRTIYYQGRIYQNRGDIAEAMLSFHTGANLQGITDSLTLARLLVAQSALYDNAYQIKPYIANNLQAAKIYGHLGKTHYQLLCLFNVLNGTCVTDDRKLADSVYSASRNIVIDNPEYADLGRSYFLHYINNFGDDESIRKMLVDLPERPGSPGLTLGIARAFSKLGNNELALKYLDEVSPEYRESYPSDYLAVKTMILEKAEDYRNAYNALKSYHSISGERLVKMLGENQKFTKHQYEVQLKHNEEIARRQLYLWITGSFVIILLLVLVMLYYRYRMLSVSEKLVTNENNRIILEQQLLIGQNRKLMLENNNTELELNRQTLLSENLRMRVETLENESVNLRILLNEQKNLMPSLKSVLADRFKLLNSLLAQQITSNESYGQIVNKALADRESFMDSTRLAFKASHPRFISYLESHGLTPAEINYLCLYALGLNGKEVGSYIRVKRHYNISSHIRQKLGMDEHETNISIYVRKLMDSLK